MLAGKCEDPTFFSINCTFEEEHICGYYSDIFKGDFNWIRGSGPTATPETGPSIDVRIF